MSDKKRYYTQQRYEANYKGLGCALGFIFVAILSLIFISLDIDFIGLSSWGYWLFIPGFFMIIGSINEIITDIKLRKATLNTVRNYESGTYKLEDIALDVGIRPKDLLRILADLRAKGKIVYRFDSNSGEIQLGQSIPYNPAGEYIPPPKKIQAPISNKGKSFCVYCGHQLDPDAKFCPNCGSQL